MKRTVEVSMLGQKFRIRSEENDDYINNVARYVEGKVREAMQGRSGASIQIVLLAAMNIADDLFQSRRKLEEKTKLVEEKVSNVINLIKEKEVI